VIEKTIRELKLLAQKKPLMGSDSSRVDELLRVLKMAGYSNREISGLIDNTLSVSTVKSRTTGIHVMDPSSKTDTIKVLSQLLEMGFGLEDVRATIALRSDLDLKEVTIEDISSLISDADQSALPLKELIKLNMERKASDLTFDQLKEGLDIQYQMRQEKLTIDAVRKHIQASKTLGGHNKVLDAIASYGSLIAIDGEVRRLTSEKKGLDQILEELHMNVKDLEEKKASAKSVLDNVEKLSAQGFDEATLSRLKSCSDKYGGPGPVLEAVEAYTSLAHIKQETATWDKERANAEAGLRKTEADNAHLKPS